MSAHSHTLYTEVIHSAVYQKLDSQSILFMHLTCAQSSTGEHFKALRVIITSHLLVWIVGVHSIRLATLLRPRFALEPAFAPFRRHWPFPNQARP